MATIIIIIQQYTYTIIYKYNIYNTHLLNHIINLTTTATAKIQNKNYLER